ncbi:hypothetical protein O181_098194 [Austropuccinia psidii MF-1]|uniref:Uncharacterized protein n=1 Tax=Austropuccinia psidii MF-1 TaxID=1389203 RepID=A0A9Q3JAB2_9BASI|nr:hypothetical protein [Austropuccinia psidii MF-1]
MVRKEDIATASTATSIIPASTSNSDYNSTVIITQNNKSEPITSELVSLDRSNTFQKAKNLAKIAEGQGSVNGSQPDKLCHYEAYNTVLPSKRADTTTRSLSGHIKSQPEGLQQCIPAKRVPDPCRSVGKMHELLPDFQRLFGSSQQLQVTQWWNPFMEKEKHDAFNSRMEKKQPSTTQASAKNSPSSHQQQFQCEKAATNSEKGKRQGTNHKNLQPGLQNPKD